MARKSTKKPAPRKTKKVQEADYEVTVKDTTPGSQTPEKSAKVNAANPDQALDTAMGGKQPTGAEEVIVKKSSPTAGTGAPKPGGVMSEAKIGSIKAITEAADYPYSVSLPKPFRKFLESVSFDHMEVGSTVMVRFDNKSQLSEAISVLKKSDADEATVILNGISRSVL